MIGGRALVWPWALIGAPIQVDNIVSTDPVTGVDITPGF